MGGSRGGKQGVRTPTTCKITSCYIFPQKYWYGTPREEIGIKQQCRIIFFIPIHGLQSRPPSPKRAERKVRRRPFREAGSGQNNGTR